MPKDAEFESGPQEERPDSPDPLLEWETVDSQVAGPKSKALARGAVAVGALALGAFAVGTLAIGSLVIGRLTLGRARIKTLEIDHLIIRRFTEKK